MGYAYTSFRWSNRARGSAGVTCVVFSLRSRGGRSKYIFTDEIQHKASRINPYLADAPDVWLGRRSSPLCGRLPRLGYGSMPNDGGNLLLTDSEKSELLDRYPESLEFIKGYCGADEFIKGKTRWCLHIPDQSLARARAIPDIDSRLEGVRFHRQKSSEKSTNSLADFPNRFYYYAHKDTDSLIVPSISSERRTYIPIGYVGPDIIGSNKALVMYEA
ncbi:type IIL restriction-modification enzyme MmeI, partial [Rhodococcus baikonurensis]